MSSQSAAQSSNFAALHSIFTGTSSLARVLIVSVSQHRPAAEAQVTQARLGQRKHSSGQRGQQRIRLCHRQRSPAARGLQLHRANEPAARRQLVNVVPVGRAQLGHLRLRAQFSRSGPIQHEHKLHPGSHGHPNSRHHDSTRTRTSPGGSQASPKQTESPPTARVRPDIVVVGQFGIHINNQEFVVGRATTLDQIDRLKINKIL